MGGSITPTPTDPIYVALAYGGLIYIAGLCIVGGFIYEILPRVKAARRQG